MTASQGRVSRYVCRGEGNPYQILHEVRRLCSLGALFPDEVVRPLLILTRQVEMEVVGVSSVKIRRQYVCEHRFIRKAFGQSM
jgi:hypothetical protein